MDHLVFKETAFPSKENRTGMQWNIAKLISGFQKGSLQHYLQYVRFLLANDLLFFFTLNRVFLLFMVI